MLGLRRSKQPTDAPAIRVRGLEKVYKMGVETVRALDGVALDDSLMQADGIPPNAEAQPLMLDNAWPVIDKALKSIEETD